MGLLSGHSILALTSEFPPFRGGIGTYAFSMAEAAAELGAAVTVLAPDYGNSGLDDAGAAFRVVRFRGGPHAGRDAMAKLRLTREAIRGGGAVHDIVHAMDWPFFIPAALSTRSGQRRLLTVHGSDTNDMARRYKRLAIATTRVFSAGSEVIANSAFTLSLLKRNFPTIMPRAMRYAHLGVGPFWHVPVDRSDHARARLGLPTDKFVLLTVGRITRRKGQLHVVQALDLLPAPVLRSLIHLIVGPDTDATYASELDAAILQSRADVLRLRHVSNETLRDLYANADVMCLAGQDVGDGKVEGFGLVFLEGGAQGLPAIAGAIGAVEEVVLNERTGIVVPSRDAAALAQAIMRMVEAPALRTSLSAAARLRAADLNWRRCAELTYAAP